MADFDSRDGSMVRFDPEEPCHVDAKAEERMMTKRVSMMLAALAATLLCSPVFSQATLPDAAQMQQAAMPMPASSQATWWKHAFVYEIYPRSFQDTNGDGVGDLNGITERLAYIEKLGVDAIWIAPMFPSPQVDFGYDVSDYEAVDPQYGTMADMQRLIAEAQKRHIRILLDFVVNHTSDKHKWFLESASSRSNPKADWYDWNDGVKADASGVTAYQKRFEHDGMVPPNNWVSLFGGSAWTWSPVRKQFYYHKFYKEQPDLNWSNPAVEKAMFDQMRFWLDRGVAGFRLDAVPTLFEDPQLRNEPEMGGTNAYGDPNVKDIYTNMLPGVHGVLERMRKVVDGYPGDRVLIGETYLPDTQELKRWYGTPARPQLQLPMDMIVGFHTEGDGNGSGPNVNLNPEHLRTTIEAMETELGQDQPLIVFDNHDNARSWDRFSNDANSPAEKLAIAKIIGTMLFTTRATALSYYGAEIGMKTTVPARKEDVKDPIGITGWPKEKGRDGERTPMQWTPAPQAGFSTDAHTWLPIPPTYKTVNVQDEQADPNSLLRWYEALTGMRRSNPALHDGGFVMLQTGAQPVVGWVRTAPAGGKPVLVLMNMSHQPQHVTLDLASANIKGSLLKPLMMSDASLRSLKGVTDMTLPPYASLIATVE